MEDMLQPQHGRQAYSYVRFSSPDQAAGDSLRRQTEMAETYAKERGLQLNSLSFRDLGISAFSGSNRTEGALSAFIKACQSGRVPAGSALLVESLDRLSREQVRKALRLLLELIDDHGTEIHTLADKHVYGKGTDMPELMYSLMVMSRANEESVRKSQRVGAAWRQKKTAASKHLGIAITANAPAWILAEKGKPFMLIKERAQTVKRIFELAISGLGSQLIAQHLNDHYDKFTTSGRGWHKSYVEKILRNPATYGAYVPHKNVGANGRAQDGEPILDFFPPVVDYATFQAVQTARTARYRARKGSTSSTMNNLFAGLLTDTGYDLPMVYYWKGRELITNSYRLGKKPNRIEYDRFEKAFLLFLDQLDWTTVLDVTESDELKRAEHDVATIMTTIDRSERQAQKLTDLLLDTPSKVLKERLLQTEAAVEKGKLDLADAQKRLDALRSKHNDLLDKSVVFTKLAEAKDLETRARLRQEIRRKVDRIDLSFGHPGPQKNDTTMCFVRFVNGAKKMMLFFAGGVVGVGSLDDPSLDDLGVDWRMLRGGQEFHPDFEQATREFVEAAGEYLKSLRQGEERVIAQARFRERALAWQERQRMTSSSDDGLP